MQIFGSAQVRTNIALLLLLNLLTVGIFCCRPVLVSKDHVKDEKSETTELPTETDTCVSQTVQCEWVVQPMRWGLVPHWHTGDIKSVGYQMINARSDGILSKRTFKGPLEKGRRCVILIEG